jgi:pyridoxal phosphate enzyme (YggS family)
MSPPDQVAREVEARVAEVLGRIAEAARRAGREPSAVTLVGASKRQPIERIAVAVRCGVRHLGENYVQETRDKRPQLEAMLVARDCPLPRWHMIGNLQRNKVRDALPLFDLVETVDRPELAREIDKRIASGDGRRLDVLAQVNVSGEPQKSGVSPEALPELLKACALLETLRVVGLMTVPAASGEAKAARKPFARLRELRDHLRDAPGGEALRELSMGMSGDFELAIEEGATLVRVGTALFGVRKERI